MTYFVYILYSEKLHRYYVGATGDLAARMESHLWMHKGFTSKVKDWELKHSESFADKSEAFARERQIKKWKSRIMIEKLINAD
ncbi:MAG: GIY-YIG nuclease family protein [Flavobacteriales bacterium]